MADTDTLYDPVYPEVASTPGMPTPPPITFGDPSYWQPRTVTTRTKDDVVEPETPIQPQQVQLGAVAHGPLLPGQGAALLQRSLTPEQFQAQMARLTSIGERQADIGAQQSRLVQDYEARRAPLEAQARGAFQSYAQALEEPRPAPPALEKMPEKPDLTPRPWLDPEGGNALRVIAQGIGALAVGVSGLAVGAPKTMLRYYREALQDWQLDQHERGNAKWHEFQGELERVRGDNADALKVYELLDRQWGTNVEAKRAAAIAQLDALGLEDQALRAASLPYERQREALDSESRTIMQTVGAANTYDRVNADILKAQADVLKAAGATGKPPASAFAAIRDSMDPTKTPEERRRYAAAAKEYMGLQQQQFAQHQGIQEANKQIGLIDTKRNGIEPINKGLEHLLDDYTTLEKAGILRVDPSHWARGMAWLRQQFGGRWTPDVQEAYGRVLNFYPATAVGFDRVIMNDIGVRTKEAYGPISDSMKSISEARGLIKGWRDRLKDVYGIYTRQRQSFVNLAYPTGGGPPDPLESAEE